MHDILLSAKRLREHKAVMDLEKNELELKGCKIKMLVRGINDNFVNTIDKDRERNYILAKETLKVPKRASTWIK